MNGRLSFSEDNLLLKAAGDTAVIDVDAGSAWKAESMAGWCFVEEGRGEAAGKLVIRVAPSDDVYERGTAVKVSCGDNVVRLAVRQLPMEFEVLEGKRTLDFGKEVARDTLKISTNMGWKVEIADTTGWLQVADTAGIGSAALVFTAEDNSEDPDRTTTVRLRYGVRSLKFVASQKGGIRLEGNVQKHYGNREPQDGFNLIFLGDGFVEKDLIGGTGAFDRAVEEATEALFNTEPYKSYREYFNVWSIACVSAEQGAGGPESGPKKTAFFSAFTEDNGIVGNNGKAFEYAMRIMGMTDEILRTNTAIVVLVNDGRYGGQTYWFIDVNDTKNTDFRSVSYVPLNRDTGLPGGFANIFLHEVGGHGIAKLADEWAGERVFTMMDKTFCMNQLGKRNYLANLAYPNTKALMAYPNYYWPVFYYGTEPWKPYEEAGAFKPTDGGFGFVSGTAINTIIVHSEEHGCMINHLPYFNVGSRFAIVQWLMLSLGVYPSAGQELTEFFLNNDRYELPGAYTVADDRPMLPMPKLPE